MTLRPSLSLVYGVRVPPADVDRVRALCDAGALPGCEVWDGGKVAQPHAIVGATGSLRPLVTCDGELGDGLPLDVRDHESPLSMDAAFRVAAMVQRLGPVVPRVDGPRWWIVGRVS